MIGQADWKLIRWTDLARVCDAEFVLFARPGGGFAIRRGLGA
jgi:hypothetical protein